MVHRFEIEYQPLNITPGEAERRLFSALSLVLDINDIYEEQNDKDS